MCVKWSNLSRNAKKFSKFVAPPSGSTESKVLKVRNIFVLALVWNFPHFSFYFEPFPKRPSIDYRTISYMNLIECRDLPTKWTEYMRIQWILPSTECHSLRASDKVGGI